MPFAVTTSGSLYGQQLSANSLSAMSLSQRPLESLPTESLRALLAVTEKPFTQQFAERYRRFRLATPWFHTLWYAAYDNDLWPAIYVQGPRFHAKTSTVLTYAIRRLVKCQHTRIGIISGTDGLTKKFLGEIRFELLSNEALRDDFNGGRPFVGDKWTEHEITLSGARSTEPCDNPDCPGPITGKDVSVFAASRGSQVSSRHCDILIVDDPENAESVRSEDVREATREWWSREVLPVLVPGGKMIVLGCLASGTPVLMADGSWRAIEQVRVGEEVWTAEHDEASVAGRPGLVEAVLDQGVRETIEVRTRTSSVRATTNHPFLVRTRAGRGSQGPRGVYEWRRADELAVGDFVVELKEGPGAPQNEWADEEFCWLLGYLFGDGWASEDSRTFWCALGVDEGLNARVLAALRSWFPMVSFARTPFGYIRPVDTRDGAYGGRAGTVARGSSVYGSSALVTRALADMGLGMGAKGKRVPEWVFRSPVALRIAFLRGMCDADGHWDDVRGSAWVELANRGLVEDLRRLALASGVRPGSTIYRQRARGLRRSDSWSIGLNFRYTDRPEGVGGRGKVADGDIYGLGTAFRLARVKSLTPMPAERVWDLTVAGTHTFTADGLVVHNTRKHYADLYSGFVKDPEFHVLDQAKSVFLPDGSPIWPEMWSVEALLAMKAKMDAQDLLAWAQEYLNEPRPSGTQMFFPQRWPTFTKAPWGLTILQFWDLAISEKTTADYTVGWTVGVDEQNNVFLLERRKGHWDFNRTLAEIEDMGKRWAGDNASGTLAAIGIEQVAYQAAAVQESLRRTMLPIVPVVPDKDKVTRARLLEARAAANKVIRPADAEWWADFVPVAEFFPDGAHDDDIDGLGGAVRLAGWQADTIGFAYGVWTCANCKHMFTWAAGRACPKCGTKAPDTFENPEAMSYGTLGQRMDEGPLVEYGDMTAGREAPVMVPLDRGAIADRVRDEYLSHSNGSGRPKTLLTAEQEALRAGIEAGRGVGHIEQREYRGRMRGELQTLAAWYVDSGQDVKAIITLEEVRRLDHLHGVQL
jgi:predicted phage terminase large subunit-like protein